VTDVLYRIYHPEKSVIGDCTIGDGCTIHAPVWIGNGVVIGPRTKVQAFAFIPPGVTIGADVFVGPHVCFTNDKYPPGQRIDWLPTIVEDRVSIGAGAVILPGIRLGAGCRIAAGAVVTKDVAPGELSFGARR
jgi:UDP-2-acetamido-3-amino-2,3-dideoxy-glucuronate N-acetyltransferase